MARKQSEICFFCDQAPCVCAKLPRAKRARPPSGPTPDLPVEPAPVSPPQRTVRKVTSAPPPDAVILACFSVPLPMTAAPPKKIERHLTDEELAEVVAIQNFIKVGLMTLKDNPHVLDRATMQLTPEERARAWRVML